MSDEELSLKEEIEAAFKDSSAKGDEVDNEGVIDKLEEKPAKEPVQKEAEQENENAEAQTETKAEGDPPAAVKPDKDVTLTNEKAPTSWSPAVREKWNEVPAEVRAEIIRREEASANGVRKLHEEYAPIRQFAEGLTPFIQEARQNGLDPTQYIQGVMASERGLRNPDPQQRFQVLLNIAEQYGIPLRDIINQNAGQEVIPQRQPQYAQLDPNVQRQLQDLQRAQYEAQQNALMGEIERFKSDKEFFGDVSEIMADLLDANRAKDMSDAYEQACWVHPEVRKVLIQREKDGKKVDDLKKRQAAASGASVKSSGEADIKVDGNDDDDDIEATVRKAIIEASGRV